MTEEIVTALRASKANLTIFKNKFLAVSEDTDMFIVSDNVSATLLKIENILNKMPKSTGGITIDDVISIICSYFRSTEEEVIKRARKREHVVARQFIMYYCRREINPAYTTTEIGKRLNDLDHSTVIYGTKQIENYLETDERKRKDLAEIKRLIEAICINGGII